MLNKLLTTFCFFVIIKKIVISAVEYFLVQNCTLPVLAIPTQQNK